MERNETISIAKAMAIILMVIGHARIGIPYITKVIYTFHMPLFFILSGLCFKEYYLSNGWLYVVRRIKGIYWPYWKWGILFLLLHNVFYHIHIYDANYCSVEIGRVLYSKADILAHLNDMFLRMDGHELLLGTFWFLKQLLLGSLLFYSVLRICRNNRWATLGALVTFSLITRAFHIMTPVVEWTWLIPYSATFITIGYILQKVNINKIINRQCMMYVCMCIALILAGAAFNMHTEMRTQSKFTLIPYIIPAFAGSILVLLASRYLHSYIESKRIKNILIFIGDHTLEIMALHFLAFKFISLLIIKIYGMPIEQLAEFPVITEYARYGWWVAYVIVGVGLPICYAYVKCQMTKQIINKYN